MRLRRFVTGLISETDISFRLRAVTQYSTISAFTFQAIRSIFNLFKLTTILRGSTSLYVKGTLMNLYDNQPLTVAELRRLQALENRYRNAAREVFTNRVNTTTGSPVGTTLLSPSVTRRPAGEAVPREELYPSITA